MENQLTPEQTNIVNAIKQILDNQNPEPGACSFPIEYGADVRRIKDLFAAAGIEPNSPGIYWLTIGQARLIIYKNHNERHQRHWVYGHNLMPTVLGQSSLYDIRLVIEGLEGNPMPERFEMKEFEVAKRLKVICLKFDLSTHHKHPYFLKFSFDGIDKHSEEIDYVQTLEYADQSTRDCGYASFLQEDADKFLKQALRKLRVN